MHRFAHDVVPTKRKGNIADAAAYFGAHQVLLDPFGGADEINRVIVVLVNSRGHGQHVRIKNDILGRKSGVQDENAIGTLTHLDLSLEGIRLALIIESHHHDRRAVAPHQARLFAELLFAFLERDRVHDALALQALQPRLEHRPLRAVDHDGHFGDVGLRAHQVEEMRHGLLGVEQAFVHVDVEDVRAAVDLLLGDGQRGVEIARFDQLRELR